MGYMFSRKIAVTTFEQRSRHPPGACHAALSQQMGEKEGYNEVYCYCKFVRSGRHCCSGRNHMHSARRMPGDGSETHCRQSQPCQRSTDDQLSQRNSAADTKPRQRRGNDRLSVLQSKATLSSAQRASSGARHAALTQQKEESMTVLKMIACTILLLTSLTTLAEAQLRQTNCVWETQWNGSSWVQVWVCR